MVYFDYLHRYVGRLLPKINPAKEYDLAVSFINPHHICASKVRGKKKIAWIHTDYSFFRFDTAEVMRVWSKYNYIASISESCTTAFATQFPALANKIVLIENVLSPTFILRQALSDNVSRELDLQTDTISICSVGRFTEAKNFDNVPAICKRLVDNGLNAKWFLVGYGGEEALIRAKIAETGMSDHVIIIGKRSNPYPYINACTLYVQPSRYEGKAVTVREAQILCKPVVITRYTTSASQLRDGFDGIIAPMDNEGCALGIKRLIEDKALQNRLIENCRNSDFGNRSEVEKFCKLIEND
jgi:glycosyltransferase involved in cell wall biosynthesis